MTPVLGQVSREYFINRLPTNNSNVVIVLRGQFRIGFFFLKLQVIAEECV